MQDKEIIWIDDWGGERMVTRYKIDSLACKHCGSKKIVKNGVRRGTQCWSHFGHGLIELARDKRG